MEDARGVRGNAGGMQGECRGNAGGYEMRRCGMRKDSCYNCWRVCAMGAWWLVLWALESMSCGRWGACTVGVGGFVARFLDFASSCERSKATLGMT